MTVMLLLDEHNAVDYLRRVGWIEPDEPVEVQTLPGGVSNQVLYVSRQRWQSGGAEGDSPLLLRGLRKQGTVPPDADFVVKQVREQLRVPDPWFSRIDRIWREVEVLRVCQELLSTNVDPSLRVQTPRILHEDRENYVFAMTAAPREHRVWKRELLEGRIDPEIARQCGRLLGQLHARSWGNPQVEERLCDREIFDELRLDPYYRTVAKRHPDAAPLLTNLVDSVLAHRRALVHADFSPKNLLLAESGHSQDRRGEGDSPPIAPQTSQLGTVPRRSCLLMVDFETGHYGDPAFDLGFFLAHLVLKAVHAAPNHGPYLDLTRQFWCGYRSELWPRIPADESAALEARGVLNFAGCAWARVDGKSQVEYLTDETRRDFVRTLCRGLLEVQPQTWNEALDRVTPP